MGAVLPSWLSHSHRALANDAGTGMRNTRMQLVLMTMIYLR